MPLYQGDDLINLMTVRIRMGEEYVEIEDVDVQIGPLCKHYHQPNNPFTVNIRREESINLSTSNSCHACVWYWDEVEGVRTLLKKTCEGTLTINTNPEIINGRNCGRL